MWTAPTATDAPACLALELELLDDAVARTGSPSGSSSSSRRYLVRSHAFEIDTARKRVHQELEAALSICPTATTSGYLEHVEAVTLSAPTRPCASGCSEDNLVVGVVGTHAEIGQPIAAAIPSLAGTTGGRRSTSNSPHGTQPRFSMTVTVCPP